MQPDWSDLRILLAIARGRGLAPAGRLVGVDATTIARRLRRLEGALAAALVERRGEGQLALTPLGKALAAQADRFDREVEAILQERRGEGVAGTVRLTAPPMLINRVLIPQIRAFAAAHPALDLQLEPDIRNLSLLRREADMALRLGRPQDGGHGVQARLLCRLRHAAYEGVADAPVMDWIGYRDAMRDLPQAAWMEGHVAETTGSRFSPVRVGEIEGAVEAAAAGLGRTVLPCLIGDADRRLRRIEGADGLDDVVREVWLLTHMQMVRLPHARAVQDWLTQILSAGAMGRARND